MRANVVLFLALFVSISGCSPGPHNIFLLRYGPDLHENRYPVRVSCEMTATKCSSARIALAVINAELGADVLVLRSGRPDIEIREHVLDPEELGLARVSFRRYTGTMRHCLIDLQLDQWSIGVVMHETLHCLGAAHTPSGVYPGSVMANPIEGLNIPQPLIHVLRRSLHIGG